MSFKRFLSFVLVTVLVVPSYGSSDKKPKKPMRAVLGYQSASTACIRLLESESVYEASHSYLIERLSRSAFYKREALQSYANDGVQEANEDSNDDPVEDGVIDSEEFRRWIKDANRRANKFRLHVKNQSDHLSKNMDEIHAQIDELNDQLRHIKNTEKAEAQRLLDSLDKEFGFPEDSDQEQFQRAGLERIEEYVKLRDEIRRLEARIEQAKEHNKRKNSLSEDQGTVPVHGANEEELKAALDDAIYIADSQGELAPKQEDLVARIYDGIVSLFPSLPKSMKSIFTRDPKEGEESELYKLKRKMATEFFVSDGDNDSNFEDGAQRKETYEKTLRGSEAEAEIEKELEAAQARLAKAELFVSSNAVQRVLADIEARPELADDLTIYGYISELGQNGDVDLDLLLLVIQTSIDTKKEPPYMTIFDDLLVGIAYNEPKQFDHIIESANNFRLDQVHKALLVAEQERGHLLVALKQQQEINEQLLQGIADANASIEEVHRNSEIDRDKTKKRNRKVGFFVGVLVLSGFMASFLSLLALL